MYNTTTGKFFHTGSYGGGGGGGDTNYPDLNQIPPNIVSSSILSSDGQGSVILTTNGVATDITNTVGLETTDSPQFVNLTLTGNAVVAGNLTVNGTTTEISTTHMTVEDTFILLGSGSADAGLNDCGIIVEQALDGTGTALFWDTSEQNWAVDVVGASATSNNPTSDVNIVTVQLNGNSSVTPASTPLIGNTNTNRKGHFYVDTDDSFGLYVYV
jgi:hypothetical protein